MYECPNECSGNRFFQTVIQTKRVIVNERGEVITSNGIGEPDVSGPRCAVCGEEVDTGE